MAEVIWTQEAAAALDRILNYIEQDNPMAADDMARRLIAATLSLQDFPHRGRPAAGGCRELVVVLPYHIRYRVERDRIRIIDIRHSAQQADC